MRILLKNALVYQDGMFPETDVLIVDGIVSNIASELPVDGCERVFDCSDMYIFPGLADVHVHLREPGFSYKETIASGTLAGAAGGFTALCAMPNLSPAPDCEAHLQEELDIIRRTACVPVYPYACLTSGGTGRGELVDFKVLSNNCVAFSDDGKGIQSEELMRNIMLAVRETGKCIAAHCEDESLLYGGYIHDGAYAHEHGHKGICSESEWGPIERDLKLIRETGCDYHVCHISAKESVELLRMAKAEGLPVSGETAPHYLLLCDADLQEDGRYKMNPPLRSAEDRAALLEGVRDGTIDILATDHAPHSAEEKSKGLSDSSFGIVGLETALSANWTALVAPGLISPERLVELMSVNPRKRFGLPAASIKVGSNADLCVFDPREMHEVDPEKFLSMGHATPFSGMQLYGQVMLTIYGDRIVFEAGGNQ